jgi:hypothetical protein
MSAKWDDATTYLFLQIVLDQKRRYNWSKMGLTKHGWNQVYKEFQAQTGNHWENKVLNNKLNTLKKSYNNWRKLLNHTGLGCRTDGAVTADDTFWAGDDPVRYLSPHMFSFTIPIPLLNYSLRAGE